MFSSIILNNFAFEICLWIFLSEFCVSYKVCVYIYFIPYGFQLIIHHLLLEKLRDIVFIWVWISSLTDSAVLTAGATEPSDLWGKRGRHFPYWPQGGAKPSSLPHPQACSLQPWLSPAEGSCVSSGSAGLRLRLPSQPLYCLELSLLGTRWVFSFRRTRGGIHTEGSWVSWWPRRRREEKVRITLEKLPVCKWLLFSDDPEGLGVESCGFN